MEWDSPDARPARAAGREAAVRVRSKVREKERVVAAWTSRLSWSTASGEGRSKMREKERVVNEALPSALSPPSSLLLIPLLPLLPQACTSLPPASASSPSALCLFPLSVPYSLSLPDEGRGFRNVRWGSPLQRGSFPWAVEWTPQYTTRSPSQVQITMYEGNRFRNVR